MPTMKIAIAGTGGLARAIAIAIERESSHQMILLSRSPKPQLSTIFQVVVVDYNNQASLLFALRGIDTVVSTVTGLNQIELIKAAAAARVRRFAPAEFEGLPGLRPPTGPLDRGRAIARQWLQCFAQHMQSTTFVCGVFYERFQPGGLARTQIGGSTHFSGEGDYVMNCRTMTAQVPGYNDKNEATVAICMTSIQDVGRFVNKALDLPRWPAELRMTGQRVAVRDLVMLVQQLTGQMFNPIQWPSLASMRSDLRSAVQQEDFVRQARLQEHIATAEGRLDFINPDLNQRFPMIRPQTFQEWFLAQWTAYG